MIIDIKMGHILHAYIYTRNTPKEDWVYYVLATAVANAEKKNVEKRRLKEIEDVHVVERFPSATNF